MLQELSIRDFAIIDEISLTFHEGLTVLTGETGAGKSIIIDAIQLLAGGRGSVEFVRHGAKKAEIEGLFIVDDDKHPVYEQFREYGIEIEDGMIVLNRSITASGKSICRVNGKLVTLAILKEFGKTLIDVHSQHETQSLMDKTHHIELLDMSAPEHIEKQKEEYLQLYNRYLELNQRFKKWNENEQELSHRLDLLEFQKQELENAQLSPNEDTELEEERSYLVNYEKIHHGLQTAYNALYGELKGVEWLRIAEQALQEQKDLDPFIKGKSEQMTNAYFAIEELTFDIRNYSDSLQYDEARLNEIEARLDEINRLKKKYGPSVNEMLEYLATIEEELEQITNKDSHLSKLEEEMNHTLQDAYLEAKLLHELRVKAAENLTAAIHQELKSLYLEKSEFRISFETEISANDEENMEKVLNHTIKLHHNGLDNVQFLISTNQGEPLKELNKVASGGELSRIMLALKTIFSKHQGVTSVIFDEVDTGVSGRVAQSIAEKIYEVSIGSQVLCISHLPQVAAMSDHHKLILKVEKENRTATLVEDLAPEKKVEELSRMMTGSEITDTAKKHATELLNFANQTKKDK